MEDLSKKIEGLKAQQEQARELFIKYQGAIEVLQLLIKEEENGTKENKKEHKSK